RLPAENQGGRLRRPKIRGGTLRSHHPSDQVPLPPCSDGGRCDQKVVKPSNFLELYGFGPVQHISTVGGIDRGSREVHLGIDEVDPPDPKVLREAGHISHVDWVLRL